MSSFLYCLSESEFYEVDWNRSFWRGIAVGCANETKGEVCCEKDGGTGPSLSVFKYGKQTALVLHLSKAIVVSDQGKGRIKNGHVSFG